MNNTRHKNHIVFLAQNIQERSVFTEGKAGIKKMIQISDCVTQFGDCGE